MAKSILDQSQILLDDFYGGFRPATGFFDITDVAYRLIDARDEMLEQEFLVEKNKNKNQYPTLNNSWLKREKLTIEKDDDGRYFADVCTPIYELPMDETGAGIQSVDPSGQSGCAEFIRITNQQTWSICLTATTNSVFFAVEGCRIWLYNFFGCCQKLEIVFVPSQAGLPLEQQFIPDGKAAQCREIVLNKMLRDWQIHLGKIKVLSDGNANIEQNESGLIYTDLKTK